MFDRFIGKECEAIVVFAEYTSGGSAPMRIMGVLESCNNDYIVINTEKSKNRVQVRGKSIIPIKALLVLNVEE